MRHSFGLRLSVSFVAALLLVGCGDSEHSDVRAWMQESSKELRPHIPELPQIKPLEVRPFEPGDLLSPFAVDKVVSGGLGGGAYTATAGGPRQINPDAYPLTKVPLSSIRFIGTITVDKEPRALVQVEREPIRQVRVGEYVGQNHGQVLRIVPSNGESMGQIVLKEKLLDKGAWIERESVFPEQDIGGQR